MNISLLRLYFSNLNKTEVFGKCGEWDVMKEIEPLAHQIRKAKQIVIHPSFIRRGVYNDWAIIYLETPFQLDRHINPICLPNPLVIKN